MVNASLSAATVTVMPAGLWAESTMTVGAVRTVSSRPGERTEANAARTMSTSMRPLDAPAPKKA